MKRTFSVVTVVSLLLSLVACGVHATALQEGQRLDEVILVVDEGALAQGGPVCLIWNAIALNGAEMGYTPVLVTAQEDNASARLLAMEGRLEGPVQLVVCFGKDYETVVYEAQKKYPDVNFLLIDGEPYRQTDAVYETSVNTSCIVYREIESGFLAGFAAVMEGGRSLGVCGDRATPEVLGYGYGFILGADAAAADLGLQSGAIALRYWYAGADTPAGTVQQRMTDWYASGTQTVFICDPGNTKLRQYALTAAQARGGKVIGARVDRSAEGEAVLCSAVKDYARSTREAITSLQENEGRWNADRAGCTLHQGVREGAVYLETDPSAWRFQSFLEKDYEALLDQLRQDVFPLDAGVKREVFPAAAHCSISDEGEG